MRIVSPTPAMRPSKYRDIISSPQASFPAMTAAGCLWLIFE
jgi:hypothetical protein